MGIFGIGTHGNVRIAQGLDYENFTSLAVSANDTVTGKGGEIGTRAVRLTKDGSGIATTRSDGTGGGARADQIARARIAFLDAVEVQFGVGARMKAQEMMDADGKGKPLTARIIKAIDAAINPYTHTLKPTHFVASQRDVFDQAMQDAVVSTMNARPNTIVNVDPVKIEARVVELLKKETFPMNQPGLVRAVAQAVAEAVAEATGAKEEASAIRDAALAGVSKSARAVPLPKIRSQAEFVTFFRSLSATAQHGYAVEDERAPDANGQEKRTFTYQGFVFRSDGRGPGHKTMKRGFTSWNDLSIPENKTEAMGLGVVTDGKTGGWGATGRSGVSCAKTVDGAINYLNPGGTFYVIDTTKLPAGEKAWDMESTLYENGYKERPKAPVKHGDEAGYDMMMRMRGEAPEPVPLDETNGEVNISSIPRSAIIGWVTFKGRKVVDIDGTAHDRLNSMQRRIDWDEDYTIHFNPDYKA